jgi:hypothetical protein
MKRIRNISEIAFISAFTLAVSAVQFYRGKLVKPPKYYIAGMFVCASFVSPLFADQKRVLANKYDAVRYMTDKEFLAMLDHRLTTIEALYNFKHNIPIKPVQGQETLPASSSQAP